MDHGYDQADMTSRILAIDCIALERHWNDLFTARVFGFSGVLVAGLSCRGYIGGKASSSEYVSVTCHAHGVCSGKLIFMLRERSF